MIAIDETTTLATKVTAIRQLLACTLDSAVESGLIERTRGMIGPSLLDALDALDLAADYLGEPNRG